MTAGLPGLALRSADVTFATMFTILRVLAIALGLSLPTASAVAQHPRPILAGYLPSYRFATFNPAQAEPLTDLILFAAKPRPDGTIDFSAIENAPWPALRQLQREKGLRLLVCIGGWDNSSAFPTVAADSRLRREFVKSAVEYCRTNQLQGVDLDWESPRDAQQWLDFAALLEELRVELSPEKMVTSLTVAPWKEIPARAIAAADRVQLMSYDHAGRHATLEQAERDVRSALDRGVPAAKIVLGVPLYGRDVKARERTLSWKEIALRHHPGTDVDEVDGVFYNGPRTVARKAELVRNRQLAGMMVWELGHDAPGEDSLVLTIARELAQPGRLPNGEPRR